MKLRKIKISDRFKMHPPKDEKLDSRREVFLNHSADFLNLHHPIIVNKNNTTKITLFIFSFIELPD